MKKKIKNLRFLSGVIPATVLSLCLSLCLSTAALAEAAKETNLLESRDTWQGLKADAWVVGAGSTLKSTLEHWIAIEKNEWSVIWDNPTDYRMRDSVTFYGGFEDAVGRLIDAIHQGNPELSVTLYRGNKVIHVDSFTIANP